MDLIFAKVILGISSFMLTLLFMYAGLTRCRAGLGSWAGHPSRYRSIESFVTRVLVAAGAAAGMVLAYLLCRLFLEYDQLAILGMIVIWLLGFLGGAGLGFGLGKVASKTKVGGDARDT